MTPIEDTIIERAINDYAEPGIIAYVGMMVNRMLIALQVADNDSDRRQIVSTTARSFIKTMEQEQNNFGHCLEEMCYSMQSNAAMQWYRVTQCFDEMGVSDEDASPQNAVEMALAVDASEFIVL